MHHFQNLPWKTDNQRNSIARRCSLHRAESSRCWICINWVTFHHQRTTTRGGQLIREGILTKVLWMGPMGCYYLESRYRKYFRVISVSVSLPRIVQYKVLSSLSEIAVVTLQIIGLYHKLVIHLQFPPRKVEDRNSCRIFPLDDAMVVPLWRFFLCKRFLFSMQ